jgi:type I restriction-modification system DNA methylase subunit
MAGRKKKNVCEFGDFQTPDDLAIKVVQLLQNLGFSPNYIIEPTCGRGSFLVAAATFPKWSG